MHFLDDEGRSASLSGVRVADIRASLRQSFAGRVSRRVVSGLSFADPSFEDVRSGTVAGTTVNTLCSVIGAAVLSLPLALYYSSVFVGLGLLLLFSLFSAFSVYLLVVGCDATGRYSITEVVAFALYPPQLWEEYLYQRGKERSSSLLTGSGGYEGPVLHTRALWAPRPQGHDESCRNNDSRANRATGTAAASSEGDLSGTQEVQWRSSASRDVSGEPDAAGDLYDANRHHSRSRRPREGDHSASADGDTEEDGQITSPPTNVYAGLRDAYARQEWRHRRCRRIATVLMEFMVFCSNYGTLIIYSKVIADSMPPVVSHITDSDNFLTSKYFWLASGGVVFFLLSCSRNMEELKWSSVLGFLTIFYIVLMILYRYHTQHVSDYPHVGPSEYGNIHWVRLSQKMLQTVSTFGLAFSYHYNVPYFYKELQDRRPHRMLESVAVAFPIITVCYALTGVFGYLTFGDKIADRKVGGNVVSNYPKDDLLINIGRLGLFVHFACVFPVVSICSRRGLHRLTMIGLTWAEQSALMREAAVAAGAILTAEEAKLEEAAMREVGGEDVPGETSPLLHPSGSAPPPTGYEVCSSSSQRQKNSTSPASFTVSSTTHAPASSDATGEGRASAYNSFTLRNNNEGGEQGYIARGGSQGTIDVDRDVGSPDLTTTLAIVIEAAFLVLTTVLIAATVPGIDFVIHIIGTLFSVFIVMVAPGMVGWCVFSLNGPFGSAMAVANAHSLQQQENGRSGSACPTNSAITSVASRYRFIRFKLVMCIISAVLGVCITCIGVAALVHDIAKGSHPPPI
ncbi:transmembrane amino acid transporter protein- like protein [Leptomonas seymouri]|uniref:Transmembrane amino acid transporter protein-like protein n=1 Tax=Leptomonas seymouri TaxID=5684 RepID=A0A0N1PDJ5_LEPSE|nr:transmembrane amino acid transporter protein- like protein [Leptomonas seymouri]|eukprot:KPI87380.1 transmembrane amino acid transporter protein- like protein [Leptomonas seymouri]